MVRDIIEKQKAFFRSGQTLDLDFRVEALKSLREAIVKSEPEIRQALKADLGKGDLESYMCETGMIYSSISDTLRNIRKWAARRRAGTPLAQFPARSYIIPEPYGNVLIMSPWNYPFLLCISPLVAAIAAGNTAIVKPSEYSPATSRIVDRIIRETFGPEYVAVIEGGRDISSEILEQRFDYIFFTGGKSVGKIVMSRAAEHLTPLTLELGGKSPVIVDRTADLRTSARRIIFGKFLNCGQTCVAPDYVLVHTDVADRFLEMCKEETLSMYGFDALANPDYGKIVNHRHFDRLNALLDGCRLAGNGQNGHEGICYGGRTDSTSLKIEPTVIRLSQDLFLTSGSSGKDKAAITGAEGQKAIMEDEIFGPLLPVIPYSDIESAIEYIDSHPRPLAAYIFSRDRKFIRMMLSRLHFGGGCINDTIIHIATEKMPFGGVGESGMGNYHGRYGFETFSHLKSIVDKPFWLDLNMRYQPYDTVKEKIIRFFLK